MALSGSNTPKASASPKHAFASPLTGHPTPTASLRISPDAARVLFDREHKRAPQPPSPPEIKSSSPEDEAMAELQTQTPHSAPNEPITEILDMTLLRQTVESQFDKEECKRAIKFMISEDYYIAYLMHYAHKHKHKVIMHHDAEAPKSVARMLDLFTKKGIDKDKLFSHVRTVATCDDKKSLVSIPMCYNPEGNIAKIFRNIIGGYQKQGINNFEIYLTDIPSKFHKSNISDDLAKWKQKIEGGLGGLKGNIKIRIITNCDLMDDPIYETVRKEFEIFFKAKENSLSEDVVYDAYQYLRLKCKPAPKRVQDFSTAEPVPRTHSTLFSMTKPSPSYTEAELALARYVLGHLAAEEEVRGKPLNQEEKERLTEKYLSDYLQVIRVLHAKTTTPSPSAKAGFSISRG